MFTALPARTGLPRFIGPCFCLFAVGFFANSVFGAATLTVNTNVNVSRSFGNNAEETIAINPTNPRNLFCSETYHLVSKYSSDGGITWLNSNLSAFPSSIGDVAAAWDDFGNLFLVRLGSSLRVSVALSTNGGASFSPLYLTPGSNNDQPSVVTGPSGVSGQGSVWICYTDPAGNFVAQGAAVTGLGTVGSFSAGQIAPGPGGDFGDIAIGPNGQVMVAYQDDNSGIGPDVLRINVDPDGLGPAGFGSVIDATTTQVGGFAPIPAQPRRTIDAEAGLAWDRSGGPHNGRVYLLYTDRNSTSSADTDIYVRFSDDNGTTWGSPVRVNDDPSGNGKSQFLPRIALDQTTGNIAVSFYDCRNSPGNNTVEVWATASIDGGLTFLPNIKVSAGVSSALVPAVSSTSFDFGDYSGLAFHAGTFYPCWADNSNSTGDNPNGTLSALDIYTAAVNLIVPPLVVAGDNSLDQLNVPVDATNAIAISAGAWHSLALRSDGKVLAWGNNDSSQCNVPLDLAGAMAIAAGGYHNLALKPDQTVAGWGADADGQASPPPGLADVLAIAAGAWHSLALRSNGTVIAWGDNSYGQTNVPPNLANVTALAAGGNHSLALKSDGSVAAWGENTDAGGIYAGQSTVPDGPAGVATGPWLTSYFLRPGILFAIGTCVSK